MTDIRYIIGAEWRDGGESNATAEDLATALDWHAGSAIFEISYDTRHELVTACKKEDVWAALCSYGDSTISDSKQKEGHRIDSEGKVITEDEGGSTWVDTESDEDFLDRVGCWVGEYNLSDHVTSAEKRLEERMQELKDGLGGCENEEENLLSYAKESKEILETLEEAQAHFHKDSFV